MAFSPPDDHDDDNVHEHAQCQSVPDGIVITMIIMVMIIAIMTGTLAMMTMLMMTLNEVIIFNSFSLPKNVRAHHISPTLVAAHSR